MVFRAPASGKAYDFGRASARNTVVMSNGALDWHRPVTWTGMIDRSPSARASCPPPCSALER
jgi:hypothetical protein